MRWFGRGSLYSTNRCKVCQSRYFLYAENRLTYALVIASKCFYLLKHVFSYYFLFVQLHFISTTFVDDSRLINFELRRKKLPQRH